MMLPPTELPAPQAIDEALLTGPVRAMLEAAFASGDEAEVLTIAKYASAAMPSEAPVIAALVTQWRSAQLPAPLATSAAIGTVPVPVVMPPSSDKWSGRAELSGFASTGNTQNIGVAGAVGVQRDTLRWRHKLHLAAEYQESLGIASREHYLAAYEPNFKFSPRGYLYGAAQYEADRFLGYTDRYSTSLGAGLSAVKEPGLTLDLELGPAFRHTSFTDATVESSVAARGSLDFDWKLSKSVSISQNASAYVQRVNSTLTGTTALNAKLIGPLAATFSYTVQYESQPPLGRVGTDTTSRAGLVYSF